jgi:hypothetical protein
METERRVRQIDKFASHFLEDAEMKARLSAEEVSYAEAYVKCLCLDGEKSLFFLADASSSDSSRPFTIISIPHC